MVKSPRTPLLESCESDPVDFWASGHPSAPITPTFIPAQSADATRDLED